MSWPAWATAARSMPKDWITNMQKQHVHIGSTYIVKVSRNLTKVKLTRESPRGGWYGTNLATGREIRIRTAARLRSEAPAAQPLRSEDARRIVDEIEF